MNFEMGKRFIESLSDLRSGIDLTAVKENRDISSPGLYEKFLELVAFYDAKTEENTINFFMESKIQRMRNLFPYFFSVLPNRLLVKIKPKLQLLRPLPIHVGEKLAGYSFSPDASHERQNVYCENILENHVLPFECSKSWYDYDTKQVKIQLAGPSPFVFDIDNFFLWINYTNDAIRSIYLYSLMKEAKIGTIEVSYNSGRNEVFDISTATHAHYAVHPNTNIRMLLNSPEFSLNLNVVIKHFIKSDEPISNMTVSLQVNPLIARYDLDKIFHVNYMPLLNMQTEFAEVINYNAAEESYPLIHPQSDDFMPYFIRTVTYEAKEGSGKVQPEIFTTPPRGASYRLVYESTLLNKRYRHIELNLPPDLLETQVNVQAEWTQLFEIDPHSLMLSFYNKQIGSFGIDPIIYKKFCDMTEFVSSGNILGLLKLHNCSFLRLEDFKLLLHTLINSTSVAFPLIHDLLAVHVEQKEPYFCIYKLVFKESDLKNQSLVELLLNGLEHFLNSNLGFQRKCLCEAVFKVTKASSS
ncbi:MAG: hypothetical protein GY750_04495 [Lentisphaerae bacterium]|nr:hypothetical protein [Lentisphaerota bacterium]MCP4100670.1 hypothetical protein [Lentisphaerota bacterium]